MVLGLHWIPGVYPYGYGGTTVDIYEQVTDTPLRPPYVLVHLILVLL